MKDLNLYIIESLLDDEDEVMSRRVKITPKDKEELKSIIKDRCDKANNGDTIDLNDIDVSNITDMSYLFDGMHLYNFDVSEWDVSNVKNMRCMFYGCVKFNSDLSKWDVSNVTDMECMFYGCENFNSDLSKWDVSKVKDMYRMFSNCASMKQLPSWYKDKE